LAEEPGLRNTAFASSLWQRGSIFITLLATITALVTGGGYLILERGRPFGVARKQPLPIPTPSPQLIPAVPRREVVGTFSARQTLADALAEHGLSKQEIYRFVESARPVYDLGRVAAGKPYWLVFAPDGELHEFRYPVDDKRYLTVYRQKDTYVPVMKEFSYESRVEPVSGAIDNSLFMAVKDTGEQEQLALDLAAIFTWDIDFYADIQKGDSFRMLVEKEYLDGRFVKYGPILAANITNQGKAYTGFRFNGSDGTAGYYGPDGTALKKSFLKSPLKFGRITSTFSRARLHPVLKIVRPHLGVDYAAPTGTPVVAVGSGAVEFAGFSGGSGRMVRLRHAERYETLYLHLSRMAVHRGERVAQGDVIGYVGSSGLATGPHLDFRVLERGQYVNPTRVVFPPALPIPPERFSEFRAARDIFRTRLDGIIVSDGN